MENTQLKYGLIIKWFFVIIVSETIILIKIINSDLFLFNILLNYLFLLAIIPLIFERINKGRIDPFSPLAIFTSFYLVLFGFRALDLLIFKHEIIIEDEKYYIYVLVYSILGLHFFHFGYFSNLGHLFLNQKKKISKEWSKRNFKLILISYSLISFLSLLTIIKLSGGISYYFKNIRDALVNITTGTTILLVFVLLIKIPLLIWYCDSLYKKKFSFSFYIYFGIAAILLASLGERGPLAFLIMSLLVCYHYVRKRVKFLSILILIVFLISFLVVYGQYRDFTQQGFQIKKAGFKLKIGIEATYHYFMNNFDQLNHFKDIIKYVPDRLSYQYGKTYLNFLVKPIPSFIWEGKPQGAGRVVTQNLYPKAHALQVTIAPSILGELYLNFHLMGILSGMFLFGIICRALYLFLKKNEKNKNVILFYVFCLPSIIGELRGDFNVITSMLIINLLFLIFTLKFITIKPKHT